MAIKATEEIKKKNRYQRDEGCPSPLKQNRPTRGERAMGREGKGELLQGGMSKGKKIQGGLHTGGKKEHGQNQPMANRTHLGRKKKIR